MRLWAPCSHPYAPPGRPLLASVIRLAPPRRPPRGRLSPCSPAPSSSPGARHSAAARPRQAAVIAAAGAAEATTPDQQPGEEATAALPSNPLVCWRAGSRTTLAQHSASTVRRPLLLEGKLPTSPNWPKALSCCLAAGPGVGCLATSCTPANLRAGGRAHPCCTRATGVGVPPLPDDGCAWSPCGGVPYGSAGDAGVPPASTHLCGTHLAHQAVWAQKRGGWLFGLAA